MDLSRLNLVIMDPRIDSMESSSSELSHEQFDGHTEFFAMTPEQRLIWLSEIAKFVHYAREYRWDSTSLSATE